MKIRKNLFLRSDAFILAGFIAVLFGSHSAQAATYYWDDNAATAIFGTAGASTGTWAGPTAGPTAGWSLSSTGANAFAAFTTTTADILNFGTAATSSGLAAGTITVSTVSAGNMIFGSRSGAIVLSGGTITLAPVQTTTVNNATDTINSVLAGAATSFTKAGNGILILGGANTYTGTTAVTAGTLQFAKTASLYNGTTASWTAANIKVGTGTLALNVGGTGEFTTANVTTLLTNLGGTNGTSTNGFAAGSSIGFDTTNASGSTFTVADIIANSTGTGGGAIGLTKLGSNTLVLTGANTYTGNTTITGGTLNITNAANTTTGVFSIGAGTTLNLASFSDYGVASAMGSRLSTSESILADSATGGIGLRFRGGTLQYTGSTAQSTNRQIRLVNNATNTIDASGTGSGTLSFTFNGLNTNLFENAGARTLNLIGTNTGANTFAIGLTDQAASPNVTSLTKSGTGTWVITGANTYTGATTVNAGTLLLDMTGTGALGATSALSLGGGNLSIKGKTSGATAQTLASLSLTAGTVSSITLNPNGGTSTTLTITSPTVTTGAGAVLNFNYSAGTTSGSTVGNNVVAFTTLPTLSNGLLGSGYTVTDVGGSGFATVNGSNQVVRLTDPGSAGLPVTTGSSTSNYFINSSYSTVSTTTPGSLVEALSGGVAANSVTVDTTNLVSGANLDLGANALTLTAGGGMSFSGANPYTITGSAGISGSGGLSKSGSGTVTLASANTYTGATTISTGTILLGSSTNGGNTAGPLGVGSTLSLAAAGTLNLGGFNATIGSLATTGTGTITDTSSTGSGGILQISGSLGAGNATLITGSAGVQVQNNNGGALLTNTANTYSGGTYFGISSSPARWVPSGTVGSGSPGALTNGIFGTGTIYIGKATTDQATIYLAGAATVNNAITYNSQLGTDIGSAVRLDTTGATFAGTQTAGLTGITIGAYFGGSVSITGQITGSGTYSGTTSAGTGAFGQAGYATPSGANAGLIVGSVTNSNSLATVILNNASANNNYSGDTFITATGILQTNAASQLPSGAGTGNLYLNGKLNLQGNSQATGLLSGSGTVDGVSATPTLTIGANNATGLTFSGVIRNTTGTLALTKTGSGTQTLSGANTYTGGTTITGGTLQLATAGTLGAGTYAGSIAISLGATLQNSSSASQTFSGIISGGGAILKDTNASDLNLTNTGNTYSGTTTVSAGRIIVNAPTNLSSGATSLVQSGIGQFFIAGTAGIYTNPFNLNGTGYSEGDGQGNIDGAIRIDNASTLSGTITLSGNSRIGAFNSATPTISGKITGGFGIEFYGMNSGNNAAQVFTISNTANDYSGATTITNSNYGTPNFTGVSTTLKLGASNVIPDGASASNVVFAINGTNNNATNILDLNGFSETINGLTVNAGIFATKITNSAAGASILTIGANNTTSSFGGSVTEAGSGATLGLTKSGTGTLTLSGANTYTGATTVSDGVLKAGVASVTNVSGAFGNNSALSMANVAGATLDITGFNTQVGSLTGGGLTGGNVTLGAATLTVGGDNTSPVAYAGTISGTGGALTKTGTGTLTLSGANTYTGSTIINTGGTLALSTSGSIANSPVITANGTLNVSGVTGGAWTLGSGQSLVGTGTITGSTTAAEGVFISGTHSAGNGVGTQTVNANLTYNSGSIFAWDLSVAGSDTSSVSQNALLGAAYDGATVSGDLAGTGAVFRIVLGSGETFANGFWSGNRTWSNIFTTSNSNWATFFPTFDYSAVGGAPDLATQGSFTLTGSTLSWSAVPEPSSALAGLLLGAGLLRRRRASDAVSL